MGAQREIAQTKAITSQMTVSCGGARLQVRTAVAHSMG